MTDPRPSLYDSAITQLSRLIDSIAPLDPTPCQQCGLIKYEPVHFKERRSLVALKSKLLQLKGQYTK